MKKGLFFVLILFYFYDSYSQDLHYSQYINTPFVVNPALLASKSQAKLSFQERTQWRGTGVRFRNYSLSLIRPLVSVKKDTILKRWAGVGLNVISDSQNGVLRTVGASVGFAYNLNLGKPNHYLSIGVQGGYFQKRLDTQNLISGYDANFNPISFDESQLLNNEINFGSLGAGFLWYGEDSYLTSDYRYYLGASLFHLNQPNQSFLKESQPLFIRLVAITGFRAYFDGKYSVFPNARWIEQYNTRQLNVGSYFKYHFTESSGALFRYGTLNLGLWYSVQNAIVASFELDSPTFTFGFSYDFAALKLREAQGNAGATEYSISLKKRIGKTKSLDRPPIQDDDLQEIPELPETHPTDSLNKK
jgi:type IX secretion system PorP/SprF family membrane protein